MTRCDCPEIPVVRTMRFQLGRVATTPPTWEVTAVDVYADGTKGKPRTERYTCAAAARRKDA